MKNELLVPPVAESDPNAIEVVRMWVAKGGQHVSINPLVWQDPQSWASSLLIWQDMWPMLTNKH
ncbi:MAG TPA: DUF5076 domain-containing protein [Candidatus Angelobacter sp.]|nr:DUF5076 domain-containing protein [Candidatus Angelobacter sp.]